MRRYNRVHMRGGRDIARELESKGWIDGHADGNEDEERDEGG